jgi:hypothetical protein
MEKVAVEPQIPETSFSGLVGTLIEHASALIRVELALIKTGIYEKVSACSSAVAVALVGTILGLLGLMALVTAGIIALAVQIGLVASALSFAVGLIVLALILIRRGYRQLSSHAGRWT